MKNLITLAMLLLFIGSPLYSSAATRLNPAAEAEHILRLVVGDEKQKQQALNYLAEHWQAGFSAMLLEAVSLMQNPGYASKTIQLLQQKIGQKNDYNINTWYEWLWQQKPSDHPYYAQFKADLYGLIDPKFKAYFSNKRTRKIRLDEVRWGGVRQDGIPPLRSPKMITAGQADYLDDDNIIFGISINGDVRAYPKRILAWHEMFVDTVGGVAVAGVYCTLCGTVIIYKTHHQGVQHQLGTSGFLYRSNKLMYDQATQSLWNTSWGQPVIGPLADQDITLQRSYVVTTTWAEWRRRHPDTQVLSLDTGHDRDYGEGVAYRDYFATDELMFTVSLRDKRLKNKDEILALIFPRHPDKPLAITAAYLQRRPIYHDRVGNVAFVVLTDASGANRVYESRDLHFSSWDGDITARDNQGTIWQLTEAALTSADGRILNRLPAQRAFWFGWYASYPHTRLIH